MAFRNNPYGLSLGAFFALTVVFALAGLGLTITVYVELFRVAEKYLAS